MDFELTDVQGRMVEMVRAFAEKESRLGRVRSIGLMSGRGIFTGGWRSLGSSG